MRTYQLFLASVVIAVAFASLSEEDTYGVIPDVDASDVVPETSFAEAVTNEHIQDPPGAFHGISESSLLTVESKLITVKSTSQSSSGWGGSSNKAVDGDTNGKYSGGSCTHTQKQKKPWWKAKLDSYYSIDKVVLFNRVDCCEPRLNTAEVFAGDEYCGKVENAKVRNPVTCHNKGANSVKVQKTGRGFLTLCEVKIYGNKESHKKTLQRLKKKESSARESALLWKQHRTHYEKLRRQCKARWRRKKIERFNAKRKILVSIAPLKWKLKKLARSATKSRIVKKAIRLAKRGTSKRHRSEVWKKCGSKRGRLARIVQRRSRGCVEIVESEQRRIRNMMKPLQQQLDKKMKSFKEKYSKIFAKLKRRCRSLAEKAQNAKKTAQRQGRKAGSLAEEIRRVKQQLD